MKTRRVLEVQRNIDKLTNDEDHKQDLWLYYTDGNSPSTFKQKLANIEYEHSKQERFMAALSGFFINPPSSKLLQCLNSFSDFERSIMFLLLLGFSVNDVSEYKGISCIRIQQSIAAIKDHTVWKEYGV